MDQRKFLLIISFLIVFAIGYGVALLQNREIPKKVSGVDDDMEQKIEDVNAFDEGEMESLYDDMESLLERCNPTREKKAIQKRLKCHRQKFKAVKYWRNMNEAEKAVKNMLSDNRVRELGEYISCAASDLTWYEMHCEADRIVPEEEEINSLMKYLNVMGKNILIKAQWKRKSPDRKKLRNPGWIMRSRLISERFVLQNPWKAEPHPVEAGTIIMLEKKLDGNIYVSGIPVTGIPD